MAAPYSTRFVLAFHSCTGGFDALYTVPLGYRAVVRDVELEATSTGGNMAMAIDSMAQFHSVPATTALKAEQWTGRVVLNEGERLQIIGTAALGVAVIVSGYLLST